MPSTNPVLALAPKRARIGYDRWLEAFRPVTNHLDASAGYDGAMFETYGAELEFVRQQPSDKVWTLLDAEGRLYVVAGLHFVNRVGYFVTREPARPDRNYSIRVD